MVTKLDIVRHIEKETGRTLSFDTIDNWHKHGLLPRPVRKSLGKGKGTISGYPDRTEEQALIVYRKREEGKNFEQILGELFKENRMIDINQIRERFFKTFDTSSIIYTIKKKMLERESLDRVEKAMKLLIAYNQDSATDTELGLFEVLVSNICEIDDVKKIARTLKLTDEDMFYVVSIFIRVIAGDCSVEDELKYNPLYDTRISITPDTLRDPSIHVTSPDNTSSFNSFRKAMNISDNKIERDDEYFIRNILLKIIVKLLNGVNITKTLSFTDEQIVRARDDFNMLEHIISPLKKCDIPFYVNDILTHPAIEEEFHTITNPTSVLYRWVLVLLIIFRMDNPHNYAFLINYLAGLKGESEQ